MVENIKHMEKVTEGMSDSLSISVPSKPEYVSVVRLAASSIASRIGFDVEQIEDIKVAVAEACTNAIQHGLCNNCENYNITFYIDKDKLTIHIVDKGNGFSYSKLRNPDVTTLKEGGLGIFIIKSLMDEVEVMSDLGKGTSVKMIKYLGDGC